MKTHESLWYGIIAWAIVLIGTFAGLLAWWSAATYLLGYYTLWSLLISVPTGLCVWLGIHFYQRHRWLLLPCMLITPAVVWAIIRLTNGPTLETSSSTLVLVLPFVYSVPSVIVAWVVAIFGAERLRRRHAKVQLPLPPTTA